MIKIAHPVVGTVALLTIIVFWLSTTLSELVGSPEAVTAVKTAIPWGFLLLIPALAVTGASGFALSRKRSPRLIAAKIGRTAISAANGVLVLAPSALFLAFKARGGEFDGAFYSVQALELMAGGLNIILLGLNMRDGFRMKGRFQHRSSPRTITSAGA